MALKIIVEAIAYSLLYAAFILLLTMLPLSALIGGLAALIGLVTE